MSEDHLKLTAYFGERERAGEGLLADALLDVYARHRVETSILLRGVEGFGLRHLRTDRLLSLSEDLPLLAMAVDTRERIEALLPEVNAIRRRGLLTLERARVLGDGTEVLPPAVGPNGATKLTVYLGRKDRAAGRPAFLALCDLLRERDIAGATALLGVDGTVRGGRERGRFFSRNGSVPMAVLAIGRGDRIGAVLPEIGELLHRPLVTLERVRICKRDGEPVDRPHPPPGDAQDGTLLQRLTIYTSESARAGKHPIHLELIRRLRTTGASGATSLRGVWGFHGDDPPHGDRLLQLRRRAPIVSIVVDRPDRIAASFEIVDELTAERGLVTSETVPTAIAMAGTRPSSLFS